MNRIRNIVLCEWRQLQREGWPVFAGVAYVLLLLLALTNGVSWRTRQLAANQNTIAQQDKVWDQLTRDLRLYQKGKLRTASFADNVAVNNQTKVFPDDPYIAMFYGKIAATLPSGPLVELDIGQSDLHPSHYLLSTRTWAAVVFQSQTGELENPEHLLLGKMDVAFLVIYLMPLLLLAITYDTLSGERERGILSLLLSNPLSLQTLLMAKITARAGIVVGGTLLAIVCGHLAVAGAKGIEPLGAYCLVVLLYGAFWSMLAALVNLRSASPANNALLLSLLWIVFVPVLPAMVHEIALLKAPVPPRSEMAEKIRDANTRLEDPASKPALLQHALHLEYPDLPTGAPELYRLLPRADGNPDSQENRQGLVELFAMRYAEDEAARNLAEQFQGKIDKHRKVAEALSFLSPALALRFALDRISGVDDATYADFDRRVAEFHREMRTRVIRLLLLNARLDEQDYARYPRFPVKAIGQD